MFTSFNLLLFGLPIITYRLITTLSPTISLSPATCIMITVLIYLLSIIINLAVRLYEAKTQTRDLQVQCLAILDEKNVALEEAVALIRKQRKSIERQAEEIKRLKNGGGV